MATVHRFFSRVLFLLLGVTCATAVRAADDVRFSATLTPAERTAAGLSRLTPDNVAVIDGLVRQDEAASRFKNNDVDHTRFSQRRTPREREIAGLGQLSSGQVDSLDALVRKRIVGPEPDAAIQSGSSGGVASSSGVETVKLHRPLDIHGEISYTFGRSNAGSFQGGDLILTYDDPAHRFSVLVGYSEYHGKGLPFCFYPGVEPYRSPYIRYDELPR